MADYRVGDGFDRRGSGSRMVEWKEKASGVGYRALDLMWRWRLGCGSDEWILDRSMLLWRAFEEGATLSFVLEQM